jgi:hypothetical protein
MALVLAPISTASAQTYDGDQAAAALVGWVSTVYGLTTTAVVGSIVLTVVLVVSATTEMETYMEQNAVALQHDLYMGSGATARDLALAFNVPEHDFERFAAIFFDRRHQLAPLAEPGEIDSASAHQFTEIIVDSMLMDEVLAPRVRAILG